MSAPSTASAATGRNLATVALRAWDLHVTAAHLVPLRGPVILAANHSGFLDGAVLLAAAPRPTHELAGSPAFVPPWSRLLRSLGQIESGDGVVARSGLLQARQVLESGGVLGVFPEPQRGAGDVAHVRHEAAYLALLTAAPVVPVAILGTRPPGAGADALPRWRSRIDVVFGVPVDIRSSGEPHRRAVVARSGERLRQLLADHVRTACRRTGHDLPGPIPARSTP